MSEHQHLPHVHQAPDAWHRHTDEEGKAQLEHAATVNPTAIVIFIVAMVFSIVFVLLILIAYFNSYTTKFKSQQMEGIPVARNVFETEKADSAARLASYGWIDRDAGTVHTPIEQAFDTVIAQYAEGDE